MEATATVQETTAPTPETPKEPAPAAAPEPKPISKEYQILVNREKALQREREAIRAEKAAIEAERNRVKELEQKYGVKPKSPREALERYGFSYKDATEYELGDGNPTPELIARQAAKSLDEFKAELAEKERLRQEAETKQAQDQAAQYLSDFKESCGEYLSTNTEKYELSGLLNGELFDSKEALYNIIAEHFNQTQRVLTIPEAAKLLEDHSEKLVERLLASKKIKAKTATPETPKPTEKPKAETRERSATLSNSLTPTTPTFISPKVEEDRMRRALAALG